MKQPEQLGPFRILQLLGRGGMGAVYQGLHVESGEPVAVKVLLEPFDEETPEARLRFEAEIEALHMLRHPGIVRLNGFGQEDDLLFYVMELVCGTSLHKELKKERGFLWQDVAKIGYEVCLALKHGHDRGITHRDLKPANIMLDINGVVKITDYGIAHCFGNHRLTGSNAVIGTIEFMSPEQSIAGPVGPKSDLYSLGAVLYTLLCRRPPFAAKNLPEIIKKHLNEPLEDISHFRNDAPGELVRIIRHLLERKSEDRPNNAFLVAKRLEELLESEFGSVDSVTVLPSVFHDNPSLASTDETRTAFLGTRDPKDKTGDSQSFRLQTGIPFHKDDGVPKDQSQGSEWHGETNRKSFSQYHDLTGATLVSGSFSENVTRQNSAFQHVNDEEPSEVSPASAHGHSDHGHSTVETHEGLDSTSVPGHIPTISSLRPDGTRSYSHFTTVHEDELGYQIRPDGSDNRPYISVQVAVLSLCLVILGLWAWWMLQPPSADKLYDSIISHIPPGLIPPRPSDILAAESDITKFIQLYSQDQRAERVLELHKEVKLAQLQRSLERLSGGMGVAEKDMLPVQRVYIEAISMIPTNPDEAVRRLEALVTLYEVPTQNPDLSNPTGMTVEIARRRWESLRNDLAPINANQAKQLETLLELMNHPDEIDPDRADAMKKAAWVLYSDKPWAAELLTGSPTDSADTPP